MEKKVIDADPDRKPLQILPLDETHMTSWNPQYLIESHLSEKEFDAPQLPSDRITSDDLNADEDGPIYGQKVTASWKPMTYLTHQWVYKGPYLGKRERIPASTVERYQKFRSYGDDAVIPQEIVYGPGNQLYLKSPNIGVKWPPMTEVDKVKDTIVGRIVNRYSMGVYQGDELIKTGQINWEKFLYHFIVRYIINAGDAGSWNFINNFGIDYEEDRTHTHGDPTTMLEVLSNKRISKNDLQSYEKALVSLANTLKSRVTRNVLPKVSGEELRRTQLVLSLLPNV